MQFSFEAFATYAAQCSFHLKHLQFFEGLKPDLEPDREFGGSFFVDTAAKCSFYLKHLDLCSLVQFSFGAFAIFDVEMQFSDWSFLKHM